MKPLVRTLLATLALATPLSAHAFCGFYVASGNAKLFNKASQVALVRDGDRTVMTMASDYQGEPSRFALVVPVPTVLEKSQIRVAEPSLIEHLDAFSAPRLVEYFDENPCAPKERYEVKASMALDALAPIAESRVAKDRGVTIEARYTVGEYDILILSAKESVGLEQWLIDQGYNVPAGASRVLATYLKLGMKFFVAKVNLGEQKRLGVTNLRPIQMAYESPRFMLPIRLGMANADGPQEMFVYAITRKGRVETTNYRTAKLPSDLDVPEFVKPNFSSFYRDLFGHQVQQQGTQVIFTEYCWDMRWCDPCASQPLDNDELLKLGVFWADGRAGDNAVFLTRLHLRYDRAHFPEDLVLQITGDTQNFQGRYIIRHEWTGDENCEGAKSYRASLPDRRRKAAENVATLTGWSLQRIRTKMALSEEWTMGNERVRWWEKMWR